MLPIHAIITPWFYGASLAQCLTFLHPINLVMPVLLMFTLRYQIYVVKIDILSFAQKDPVSSTLMDLRFAPDQYPAT